MDGIEQLGRSLSFLDTGAEEEEEEEEEEGGGGGGGGGRGGQDHAHCNSEQGVLASCLSCARLSVCPHEITRLTASRLA